MYPLIKKELGHFFNNPFGYIVVVLFALFANFLFVKDIFLFGQVSMRQFFVLIPWIYMVFLPAITMRALAEEKRMRTMEILQTIPLTASQIVLAKCIAILCVGAPSGGAFMRLAISFSIASR
jgi:ABC-2 type transport system permease protein